MSPTPFPRSPALKLFPNTGQMIKAHSHLGNARELWGEGGIPQNTLNWVRLNKNVYPSPAFVPLMERS